jgi:hypothetical protein
MKQRCFYAFGVFLLLGIAFALVSPAWALQLESGLLGIQIDATPRDLTKTYGAPKGIIVPGPGGLALNTVRPGMEQLFSELGNVAGSPTSQVGPPAWATPIWPASLNANQQMWVYVLQGGTLAGFIIKGSGLDATITDIIAASFKPNAKVVTERKVHLGDSYSRVLLNYGYPPLLQPFSGGTTEAAMPIIPSAAPLSAAGLPTFNNVIGGRRAGLTGPAGMTGRGGRGRGRMRSADDMEQGGDTGAGRSARTLGQRGTIGRGQGPMPTLGAAPAPVYPGEAVLLVNQRPVTFTRNCVILYDGLAFTIYNFKVVRIHVTQ